MKTLILIYALLPSGILLSWGPLQATCDDYLIADAREQIEGMGLAPEGVWCSVTTESLVPVPRPEGDK